MVETIGVGFFVGVLVGLTGIGGGSLMTPLLIFLLGVQPTVAVGTDILFAAVTKSVGGWQHYRQGHVDMRLALLLAVGSVPASIVGVQVMVNLKEVYGAGAEMLIQRALGITLILVAFSLLVRLISRAEPNDATPQSQPVTFDRKRFWGTILLGAGVGFTLGLTSVGAGSLVAVVLLLLFRFHPARLVGTDLVHAAALTLAAGMAHWHAGHVDFSLLGALLVGSVPGVLAGSVLTKRIPAFVLRPLLVIMLLGAGIKLV